MQSSTTVQKPFLIAESFDVIWTVDNSDRIFLYIFFRLTSNLSSRLFFFAEVPIIYQRAFL